MYIIITMTVSVVGIRNETPIVLTTCIEVSLDFQGECPT